MSANYRQQSPVDDSREQAAAPARSWLLRLTLPGPHGRLLTSILIFCILLTVFYLGPGDSPHEPIPALFFSLVIAYIIPIFGYITEKAQEAMRQLRPLLNLDDTEFNLRLQQLLWVRPSQTLLHLGIGIVLGGTHMSLVSGSPGAVIDRMLGGPAELLSVTGALSVWIIMTTVIAMLLHQATIFARTGRSDVRIQILNTHELLPFARVSISASLAITGALALFPLIGVESGVELMEILPGAFATLIPLLVIFVMPVWPVHQRLVALKSDTLSEVNRQITNRLNQSELDTPSNQMDPALASLLVFRREVAEVSTWPFDLGNVAKLSFYMIIPPLTWVAAALIENVVDAML